MAVPISECDAADGLAAEAGRPTAADDDGVTETNDLSSVIGLLCVMANFLLLFTGFVSADAVVVVDKFVDCNFSVEVAAKNSDSITS